jgi:hypothetical protein
MKFALLLSIAALVLVGIDTCNINPGGGQSCCDDGLRSQYIISSTELFQGNAGVKTFNDACQAFGPNVLWCDAEEIIDTAAGNAIPTEAWVRPVGFVAAGANLIRVFETATGLQGDTSAWFTCNGWNSLSSNQSGLAVGPGGSFDTVPCSNSLPVACCARR